MPDVAKMQKAIVDEVYTRIMNSSILFEDNDKDSYRANLGSVMIDLDRSTSGDKVTYVLWVLNGSADVISRIDGNLIKETPADNSSPTYNEMIKRMFIFVRDSIRSNALEEALNVIKGHGALSSSS